MRLRNIFHAALGCLMCLACHSTLAQDAPPETNGTQQAPEARISIPAELVQARLETLQAQEVPDEALLASYQAVLDWLSQLATHEQSLAYFKGALATTSASEAEIQARIDDIDPDASTVGLESLGKLSEQELEELIVATRTRLERWQESRNDIDRRIAAQAMEGEQARSRIEVIDRRIAEIPDAAIVIDPEAPPSAGEASQWLLKAERAALQTERLALRADLASQPLRSSRRRVERQEASLWIGILERDLQLLLDFRESQVEDPLAGVLEQFEPGTPGVNILESLLAARESLVETRARLTRELAEAEAYRNLLADSLAALQRNYDNTREIVEAAGDSSAFGPLLLSYRRQLDQDPVGRETRGPAVTIGELVIQNTAHEERLYELTSTTAYVNTQLQRDGVDDPATAAVRDTAIELARSERSLLAEIVQIENQLLPILSDVRLKEDKLELLRREFSAYLQSFILWLGTQTPVYSDFSATLMSDLGQLSKLLSRSRLTLLDPMVIPGLLVIIGILLNRRRLTGRIEDLSRDVGRPRSDSIWLTLRSFLVLLPLALPLPLAIVVLGRIYAGPDEVVTAVVREVFSQVAIVAFFACFVRASCTTGVARKHLDWGEQWCKLLERAATWTLLVFTPLLAIATLFLSLQRESYENVLGQLALSLIFIALAVYLCMVLYRRRRHGQGGLARYYPVAVVAVISTLLVQALLSGFVSGPQLILQTLLQTLLVAIVLAYIYAILVRWVLLTRRRIRFRQLTTEHKQPESEDLEASYSADLGDLSSTANELLKAVFILVGVVSLALIWSPLLPGVAALQRVVLWSATAADGSGEVVQSVTLASLFLAVLIGVVTYLGARKLPALLELVLQGFSGSTPGGRYAAVTMLNYIIVGVGIIAVLSTLGIQWSKLQWLVAALGVGIGFGLQELVANFISGLIIFFERPIRVGDLVTVGDSSGTVSRIRIRATTIVDFDRKELLVPNKEFVTGRLLNWTLSDSVNRLVFDVGIAYGSDVGRAIQLLRETVSANPRVIEEPAPSILFTQFGDNALNMSVRAFLDSFEERLQVLSDLHEAIDAAFREAGIEIAFPQRDVHFDASSPIRISIDKSD
jgi:potassium efflux system protein